MSSNVGEDHCVREVSCRHQEVFRKERATREGEVVGLLPSTHMRGAERGIILGFAWLVSASVAAGAGVRLQKDAVETIEYKWEAKRFPDLAPEAVLEGRIQVEAVTFGRNCEGYSPHTVVADNAFSSTVDKCEGKSTCRFQVHDMNYNFYPSVGEPGDDPYPGCDAEFRVLYTCDPDSTIWTSGTCILSGGSPGLDTTLVSLDCSNNPPSNRAVPHCLPTMKKPALGEVPPPPRPATSESIVPVSASNVKFDDAGAIDWTKWPDPQKGKYEPEKPIMPDWRNETDAVASMEAERAATETDRLKAEADRVARETNDEDDNDGADSWPSDKAEAPEHRTPFWKIGSSTRPPNDGKPPCPPENERGDDGFRSATAAPNPFRTESKPNPSSLERLSVHLRSPGAAGGGEHGSIVESTGVESGRAVQTAPTATGSDASAEHTLRVGLADLEEQVALLKRQLARAESASQLHASENILLGQGAHRRPHMSTGDGMGLEMKNEGSITNKMDHGRFVERSGVDPGAKYSSSSHLLGALSGGDDASGAESTTNTGFLLHRQPCPRRDDISNIKALLHRKEELHAKLSRSPALEPLGSTSVPPISGGAHTHALRVEIDVLKKYLGEISAACRHGSTSTNHSDASKDLQERTRGGRIIPTSFDTLEKMGLSKDFVCKQLCPAFDPMACSACSSKVGALRDPPEVQRLFTTDALHSK